MSINQQIGLRIKQRRVVLAMSQQDVADKLGLTYQQIQKYEYGTNRVPIEIIIKLKEIFSVPLTFFFDCIEEDTLPESDHLKMTGNMLELINSYKKLSDKQKTAVSKLIQELTKNKD